jgi:hypothetical protein
MFWLSVVVAFISAMLVVAGILRDDSGPNRGKAGASIAVVGFVGLFASAYLGTL